MFTMLGLSFPDLLSFPIDVDEFVVVQGNVHTSQVCQCLLGRKHTEHSGFADSVVWGMLFAKCLSINLTQKVFDDLPTDEKWTYLVKSSPFRHKYAYAMRIYLLNGTSVTRGRRPVRLYQSVHSASSTSWRCLE